MIIYKATNKKNGKSYIGQTIYSLEFRKASHFSEARKSNLPFHNALVKHEKYFRWKIIETCMSKEELDEMEFHYIKQYNALFPSGYNLTLGGEGKHGWVPTDRNRINMSKAQKEWWSKKDETYRKNHGEKTRKINLGREGWSKGLTKETDNRIMKISKSNTNKKHTEEQKIKIGNSVRGQKRSNSTKQLMRENQLGEKNSFYGRTHDRDTIENKMTFCGDKNPFYGKSHTKETLEKKSKNLYEIIKLNGNKELCKVFSVWCKENNINQYKLWYESKNNRFYNGYLMRKIKL